MLAHNACFMYECIRSGAVWALSNCHAKMAMATDATYCFMGGFASVNQRLNATAHQSSHFEEGTLI